MKIGLLFFLFLMVFLSLYGGLHAYLYLKLRRVLRPGGSARRAAVFLLALMTGSPVFVHGIAFLDIPRLTAAAAYAAYLWMGGLFLFFTIHLVFDMCSLVMVRLNRYRGRGLVGWSDFNRRLLPAAIMLTALTVFYGWHEARCIQVKHLTVVAPGLPENLDRLRVAHITDLHFGILDRMEVAYQVRDIVERENPDILACTGDFVDRGLHCGHPVLAVFAGMNPPGGKYAVPGNHEFYAGVEESARIMEEAGFVFLRNEVVITNHGVRIAGVDDPAALRAGIAALPSEKDILGNDDRLTILLKHQPIVAPESVDLFDMQLSGHTHNGQILPFRLLTRLAYSHIDGLHRMSERSLLYVSPGTGTWGPPVRVLAPPEVTIIDFVRN